MRALLVDDSSTMRKIQKRTMVQLDMTDIIEAEDGQEALEILKTFSYRFKLVLLDIDMPRMNGLETLKAIRKIPQMKSIPVVMCTASGDKENVQEAIRAGANAYIVRPFTPKDLKEKLDAILSRV